MQKWEHFACHMWLVKGKYQIRRQEGIWEGNDVYKYIDELGQKGWELVSVAPILGSETKKGIFDVDPREATLTSGYVLWFKRPVTSAA